MHDFGTRIRPDEVTPELREQLVADCRLSEALLQSATFIAAVAVSLVLSLVYRWHGEPTGSEWRPIAGIALLGLLAMIGTHIWFRREYFFLKAAPVIEAEVEEIEAAAPDKHLLKLKFEPEQRPGVQSHEEVVTAPLHSQARAFNEDLHPGDLVSVIYEPGNPEHVEVVEAEHAVQK